MHLRQLGISPSILQASRHAHTRMSHRHTYYIDLCLGMLNNKTDTYTVYKNTYMIQDAINKSVNKYIYNIYIYIYVYMYICIYVYMYIYIYICYMCTVAL